jgi:hypothetical protein
VENVSHLKNVHEVIQRTLGLFERYEIHATWAIVGLLAHDSIYELMSKNATTELNYSNKSYSPFPLTKEKYGDFEPEILLGKSEIKTILNTNNQELASHTYSHLYALENGITTSDFEVDCTKMTEIGEQLGLDFTSIVFPRNQLNPSFLAVCKQNGITAFRGNQETYFWNNSPFQKEGLFKKMGRVLDAYFPISTTKSYNIDQLKLVEGVLNVPANRFFRPVSNKNWLEKRKIRRIKAEMKKAAENQTIYHLWWHPHNFAKNLEASLSQLEEILAYAVLLNEKSGFVSLNLSEIVEHAKK